MRRVLWILVGVTVTAIIGLIVAIALSGTPEHFPVPTPMPASSASPSPVPTPTPVPTPAPTPVEYAGVLLEENGAEQYYFQNYALTVPTAWQGRFEYETSEDGVAFFSAANRDAGYGGLLCWIAPTMVMEEEEIKEFLFGTVLGEEDDCYYILTTPIDTQYPEDNEALRAAYKDMAQAIPELAESFRFTDGEPE